MNASIVFRPVLGAALLCGAIPAALAATPYLKLGGNDPMTVGAELSIAVDVHDVTDLYAFSFDLSFDATKIHVKDVAEGFFLKYVGPPAWYGPTSFTGGVIDNFGGSVTGISGSLIGSVPGHDGTGDLVQLSLTALAPGTAEIDLKNLVLLDSTGQAIVATALSHQIDVRPVPLPGAIHAFLSGVLVLGLVGAGKASRAFGFAV